VAALAVHLSAGLGGCSAEAEPPNPKFSGKRALPLPQNCRERTALLSAETAGYVFLFP